MDVVVQFDGAWVDGSRTQRRELGMFAVEAIDVLVHVEFAVGCAEITVTSDATGVRRGCQSRTALVLDVTGTASGSEGLARVVDRRIVTGKAGLIGHMVA
jgi:hypothetical protein